MHVGEKIQKAIREIGISQAEFARRIGMEAVWLNKIINGKVNPTVTTLQKIARGLGKSLEYFDVDYDPRRSLQSPKGYARVPILGSAPAGEKVSVDDYVEGYVDIPIDSSSGKELYLLYVRGDSMIQAGLKDGSKVIVQYNKEPKNGDIVVVSIDDEYTIKYFYKNNDIVVLRSANPAHKEQTYRSKDDIKVRGVIIGVLW